MSEIPPFEFLTLTQIARIFGTTPFEVSGWLVEAKMKNPDRTPSQKAIENGVAKKTVLSPDQPPFYAWHRVMTIRILEAMGKKRVVEQVVPEPEPLPLAGPFSVSDNGGNDFAVTGSNGAFVSVRGKANAEMVAELLNLARKVGKVK